jgi:hypothetical protein
MASTSSVFRAAQPLFRSQFAAAQARNAFHRTGGFRTNFGPNARRFQSTAADAESAAKESFFKRMWDSPVGFKTVHFWWVPISLGFCFGLSRLERGLYPVYSKEVLGANGDWQEEMERRNSRRGSRT